MGSAGPPGSHWSAELYQPFIEHFYGNCVFTSSFIHQQNCVLTSIPICFITNHPHSMIKQKEDEYFFSQCTENVDKTSFDWTIVI